MIGKSLILLVTSLFSMGLAHAQALIMEKPATTRPLHANPIEKPQATSDRAKAGATGYVPESDEETQERPRPLDYKPAHGPQATSDRAKAGATGYVPESDEETQERPNPMSGQPAQRVSPMQQQAPMR